MRNPNNTTKTNQKKQKAAGAQDKQPATKRKTLDACKLKQSNEF